MATARELGKDNGYIGDEEALAENREQQTIEVETLLSIYGDEITVITEGTEFLVRNSKFCHVSTFFTSMFAG